MVLPTVPNQPNDEPEEPFNPHEFVKRHLRVKSWINDRLIRYTKNELKTLISLVMELFKMESSLVRMGAPITVVGDIHGQFRDLVRILFSKRKNEETKKRDFATVFNQRFMFLGDYVDRGQHSLECISLVFGLKLVYPKQYALLRGNHETRSINCAYGFKEECILKLGEAEGLEIWELFNEAFSWMPLAGLIGEQVLCMHGGISDALHSLEDIENIKRPMMEVNHAKLPLDLLWADPYFSTDLDSKPTFRPNVIRGLSCEFNEAAVVKFCADLKITRIIRAHQVKQRGFEFFANQKMVTIFSAPHYMGEQDNLAAIIKIKQNGDVALVMLKTKRKGKEKSDEGGPVALKKVRSASCPVIEPDDTEIPEGKGKK